MNNVLIDPCPLIWEQFKYMVQSVLRHIRNSHKNGSKGRKNHISHTKRSFNNREK